MHRSRTEKRCREGPGGWLRQPSRVPRVRRASTRRSAIKSSGLAK
ncbi:Protein of unknown function [Pyronema omphalodes CBS 100304]|uniref:Uncharacterized protein n=1 Tax=Pyronema omphalodes (strain CBS 100304) TaxID=1076935 RepID=U4LBQ2_PYROM|nr:Protein of unknown function [Pyronema omphalodes CBS 100304]